MLRLACRCGSPLWVAARWTGTTVELVVFDGHLAAERSQSPLQQCPQCQVILQPEDLEGYPLPSSSMAPCRSEILSGALRAGAITRGYVFAWSRILATAW